MKILRLRLLNLNSLRGENAVDFTRPPLAHAGLFAITGPTGAGKSTLLDAITLALYGRVARYGSMPSPEAVMSRHTGECTAEVEFACAAGEFRSTWQLQRARKKADGKVQPAKRRISTLPAGDIIAETIKDADAKILELTGLDYDRFLRSVLLAQGDFASFLQAGAKERTDLLQQVTGTFVYQDISRAAFRRAADAEQALANLRVAQAAVAVLPPGQRTQHEANLAGQSQRLREAETLGPALGRRLEDARRWLELERAAQQLQTDEAAHAQACRESVPALERLARHERAAPFVSDLTTLGHLAREDEKDAMARRALEAAAPQRSQELQAAQTAAAQAEEALHRETDRVNGLRTLWDEVTTLDTALAAARAELRQVTQQHAAETARLAAATDARDAAEKAHHSTAEALQAAAQWLEQHHGDATLAAQLPEIQAAHTRWQAAVEAAAAAEERLARHRTEQDRVQAALAHLEQALTPLRSALARANADLAGAQAAVEAAAGKPPAGDWQSSRDRAREHRQGLEALGAEAGRIRAHQGELATARREAELTTAALQKSAGEIAQRTKELEGALALLEARRTALALAEKVQSLESHRAMLRADTPCPLCGSTHHPYVHASDTPAGAVAGLRADAAAAEAAGRDARQALHTAETLQAGHAADAKRLTAEVQKLTTELARSVADWNSAAAPHGLEDRQGDEARLAAAIAAARGHEQHCETQLTALRQAETVLAAARTAASAAEKAYREKEAEHRAQAGVLTHLGAQSPALEAALAEQRDKAAAARDAWVERTAAFVATPPGIMPAAAPLELLKVQAETFHRHRKTADELSATLGTRRATLEACTHQLHLAQAQLATAAGLVTAAAHAVAEREVRRREKFGTGGVAEAQREAEAGLQRLRSSVAAKRQELADSRQRADAAAGELTRLAAAVAARGEQRAPIEQRVQAGAVATGFADAAALRAALLDTAEAASLFARRAALEDRRTVLKTQAEGIVAQRGRLPAAAAADAGTLPALETEKSARDAELATLRDAVAEVRALLKQDDDLRVRHTAAAGRILAAEREFARWEQLRKLIGSADGSLFARFAQGLTLEHLTILANEHLRDLNPRYSIRRAKDGETGDLELEIVDHYQADAARPMRSLSGGESFLVSLALALGLSKLASGRTSIESLFIDEGFGSLDADTLEVAMAALENLQAGGKVIGVISHVPAMQERISVQITVTKESGGCSRLELRG